VAGQTNSILVDGLNHTSGLIRVNYCLGTNPVFAAAAPLTIVLPETTTRRIDAPPLLAASPPATYQWYRNNVLLSGETQSFYNIADSGAYSLVASNCFGVSSNVFANVTLQISLAIKIETNNVPSPHPLKVSGAFSRGWVLQGTTNFLNWIPLQINDPLIKREFIDGPSFPQPIRFYRAQPR
jgi:hypothetical protein